MWMRSRGAQIFNLFLRFLTNPFSDGEKLTVSVCDQGTGFDVEQPTIQGHGCGLGSMRERAYIIGAKLDVMSNQQGTTVTVTVPLA